MLIAKIFNNSVILGVDDHGDEFVLMGKGVGFQKAIGDPIDDTLVDKRFGAGGTTSADRVAAYLDEIPADDLALAEEVLAEGRVEFGSGVSEHALFPLADHISFALRRMREGMAIEYPLHWDVATFYPREIAFARRMLVLIELRRGVRMPAVEAFPLALHFVNAQFGAGEMSTTVKVTDALSDSLRIASVFMRIEIDEDSVDVARFITHVRYLILRRMRGLVPADVNAGVGAALEAAYPEALVVAGQLADSLTERFGWAVGRDERLYLALHVSRLAEAARVSRRMSPGSLN